MSLLDLLPVLHYSCQVRSGLFAITLDLLAGLSFYFVKSSVSLVKLQSEINFNEIESEFNFTVQTLEGVAPGQAIATEGKSRDGSRAPEDTLAVVGKRGTAVGVTPHTLSTHCVGALQPVYHSCPLRLCKIAGSILNVPNSNYH